MTDDQKDDLVLAVGPIVDKLVTGVVGMEGDGSISRGPPDAHTVREAAKLLVRLRDRIVEQDKLSANYNEIKRLCDAEIDALRAQLAERVPPREPTTVMINEGVNSLRVTGGNIWDDARDVWHAMYDVAPPAHPPNAVRALVAAQAEDEGLLRDALEHREREQR